MLTMHSSGFFPRFTRGVNEPILRRLYITEAITRANFHFYFPLVNAVLLYHQNHKMMDRQMESRQFLYLFTVLNTKQMSRREAHASKTIRLELTDEQFCHHC